MINRRFDFDPPRNWDEETDGDSMGRRNPVFRGTYVSNSSNSSVSRIPQLRRSAWIFRWFWLPFYFISSLCFRISISLSSVAVFSRSSFVWNLGVSSNRKMIISFPDYFILYFSDNLITLFKTSFSNEFSFFVLNCKLNDTFVFCFSSRMFLMVYQIAIIIFLLS